MDFGLKILKGVRESLRIAATAFFSMVSGAVVSLFYLGYKKFECMGLEHPNVAVSLNAAQINITQILRKVWTHEGNIHLPAHISLKFKPMNDCDKTILIGAGAGLAFGVSSLGVHYGYKYYKQRVKATRVPLQLVGNHSGSDSIGSLDRLDAEDGRGVYAKLRSDS